MLLPPLAGRRHRLTSAAGHHCASLSVQDSKLPSGKTLSKDLLAQLNANIQFLVECRPLAVSMANVIKFVKAQVG